MSPSEIVIHSFYHADGSVREIGERPESLTAQQWFNFLYTTVPESAQALAGGRTIFRLGAAQLVELKAQATA